MKNENPKCQKCGRKALKLNWNYRHPTKVYYMGTTRMIISGYMFLCIPCIKKLTK